MKRLLAVVLALSLVFSMTTVVASADEKMWETSAVTDWYNDTDIEFTISTAEQLAGLAKLVDEGNTFEDKTIKLGTDIDLGGALFDPIGSYRKDLVFKGTFDGQNYSIKNLSQNTWALDNGYEYTDLGLGLFAYLEDATVKNLVMDGASISGESALCGVVAATAYGKCTFENIDVINSEAADYQYYAGGVVGWASGNHNYIDCDVDKTTTIAAQWGDFDNSTGGVIGGAGGSAKIFMKDCDVACRIDAYSDVTSTYQWYAYRRCGMLIGNTGKTVSVDGRTNASAPQLTAENCTVTYGDWAKYTYCEFAGTSWPYVRVQAGVSNSAYSNPRYGHPTDALGNEVVDANHTHNDGEDHFILIEFNQLYGGGQGVYGTASHEGVTVKYHVHQYVQGVCVECGQKDAAYVAPTVPTVDATKPVEKVEVGIATATIDAANEVLEEVTKEVLDSVAKGEEVTNVSAEAVKAIQDAINDQDEIKITTKVVATPVKKDDVDEDDVKLVLNAADGSTVAQYFDLSVIMTVVVDGDTANAVTSKVTDLNGKKITFTIAIPEELKDVKDGLTREFYVIRVHDGKTDKLPVTVNGDGTLSFETDKFSTYALAYTDTENTKAGDANANKGTPGTGDTNTMMPWLALMAMAAVGAAVVFKRREN